jgi:pumilio RNA-binding family
MTLKGLKQKIALAEELRGHVWETSQCPHGNHVVQKCIMSIPPHASQFIIDELMSKGKVVSKVVHHKYGCRIVQRLLEYCGAHQVRSMVDAILNDAMASARHPFGNYTLQQLLEYSTPDQQSTLFRVLRQNVRELATCPYASAVLSKAMAVGPLGEQIALAHALIKESGLLERMACTRNGYVAAIRVLHICGDREREELRSRLLVALGALRSCRYGKYVAAQLLDSRSQYGTL